MFDVVLPDLIPDKGRVLTALSNFWFERTADIVPNHVISCDPTDFPEIAGSVAGRAMLVQAARPVRLECVVRRVPVRFGVEGVPARAARSTASPAPSGLHEGYRLPEPRFTPTTKAEGGHDEPLTPSEARELVGADLHDRVRDVSIALYESGAAHAQANGIILADTKFEFGERDGELILIDECMTPDSSRYWPVGWSGDGPPPSFDKQPVRDYMEATGWDKTAPAPALRRR